MTLLEQMGHQIYVNFQIWVIFQAGTPIFPAQNHIKDQKTTLNCQKDSSNTSNSMFLGVRNQIMTLLEQMGHQMYVNFQNRVIFQARTTRFLAQNHIDHKKTLNYQKDSSNTSNLIFFGVGNQIMTILQQMGHQICVNFHHLSILS